MYCEKENKLKYHSDSLLDDYSWLFHVFELRWHNLHDLEYTYHNRSALWFLNDFEYELFYYICQWYHIYGLCLDVRRLRVQITSESSIYGGY